MSLAGLSAATIFCGSAEADRIGPLLADYGAVEVAAGVSTVSTLDGELRISPLRFDGPGGPFAKIILGASNAARNGILAKTGGQEKVHELLAECDLLFGLRFAPDVRSGNIRERLALAITAEMEGVIFDGMRFMDSAGRPLVELVP